MFPKSVLQSAVLPLYKAIGEIGSVRVHQSQFLEFVHQPSVRRRQYSGVSYHGLFMAVRPDVNTIIRRYGHNAPAALELFAVMQA